MKKRVLNIKPQEVTTDGRTSVRYKGSDGKMHSLASSANENGVGEPVATSPATVQEPLVIDTREQVSVTSDEVIAALNENRQVIYIIEEAKYTFYSRTICIYDDGEPEVWVYTISAVYKHKGTNVEFNGDL